MGIGDSEYYFFDTYDKIKNIITSIFKKKWIKEFFVLLLLSFIGNFLLLRN